MKNTETLARVRDAKGLALLKRLSLLARQKAGAQRSLKQPGPKATPKHNTGGGSFFKMDSLVATNDTSKVSTARTQNTAFLPVSTTEQTQKDYNAIYHSFAYTGSLTGQEISGLTALAQLCPFTDGSSVYQARALLTRYHSTEYSNPCEYSTGEGSGNRFKELNTNNTINNDLAALNTLVYPNPASNVLNISTEIEGASIVIYNVVGQIVVREKLSAVTVIDIAKLSNGTYIIKIVDEADKIIKTDKLLITK